MSDFRRRLAKRLEDPEFAKAWEEVNDEMPHKKRSKKEKPKKSDHKHEYELVKKEEWIKSWFTHIYECKICGKIYTEEHLE